MSSLPVKFNFREKLEASELNTNEKKLFVSTSDDLCFLADITLLSISYAIDNLACQTAFTTAKHMILLKHVIRTPVETIKHKFLCYKQRVSIVLESFVGSNFADKFDGRSIAGIMHISFRVPVVYTFEKQPVVAMSTYDAKYYAVSYAIRKVKWLRDVITDLHNKLKKALMQFSQLLQL